MQCPAAEPGTFACPFTASISPSLEDLCWRVEFFRRDCSGEISRVEECAQKAQNLLSTGQLFFPVLGPSAMSIPLWVESLFTLPRSMMFVSPARHVEQDESLKDYKLSVSRIVFSFWHSRLCLCVLTDHYWYPWLSSLSSPHSDFCVVVRRWRLLSWWVLSSSPCSDTHFTRKGPLFSVGFWLLRSPRMWIHSFILPWYSHAMCSTMFQAVDSSLVGHLLFLRCPNRKGLSALHKNFEHQTQRTAQCIQIQVFYVAQFFW